MTGLTYILVGSSNSSPRLRLSSGIQSLTLFFLNRTFLASVIPFEWIPELLTPTIVSLLYTLSPRTSLFFEQIPAAKHTRSIAVPSYPSERRSGTTALSPPTTATSACFAPSTIPSLIWAIVYESGLADAMQLWNLDLFSRVCAQSDARRPECSVC